MTREQATRDSWKGLLPMPVRAEQIQLNSVFSPEEYQKIKLGFLPESMDDKWIIYLDKDWLYFHRSWNGICVYKIRLEAVKTGYKTADARVNRSPRQYRSLDDEYDSLFVQWLIEYLLLEKEIDYSDYMKWDSPRKVAEEPQVSLISRYEGCLLGLAIGDALGAPVEFSGIKTIKSKYGENGVIDLYPRRHFKAGSYTDDTQMSLATAIGCIKAYQKWREGGVWDTTKIVYHSYLEWLRSQGDPEQGRGAVATCITALSSGRMGTIENKINKSKGCGGVMRTAPVGLAFPPEKAFRQGAECAAITHGHPSGYLSAGYLSSIIAYLTEGKLLPNAIKDSAEFLGKYEGYNETSGKITLAYELADSGEPPETVIPVIGEGWVGEEALAISIYCALLYSDDWEKGVLAAVNHSGDSDSTGSITGAILGAYLGVEAVPERWLHAVENAGKIKKIAGDMFKAFKENAPLSFEEYPG